jgi:hypothetical protein
MYHSGYVWSSLLAAFCCVLGYTFAFAAQTLRCESEGFEYKRCPIDAHGGVQLMEQLSDSACRQGETWGYDQHGIWVANGCAGAFLVGSRVARDNYMHDTPFAESLTIRCESEDFAYNRCPAEIHGDVQLMRQLSHADCRHGETWGYDRRGIWVANGCAGDFKVSSR